MTDIQAFRQEMVGRWRLTCAVSGTDPGILVLNDNNSASLIGAEEADGLSRPALVAYGNWRIEASAVLLPGELGADVVVSGFGLQLGVFAGEPVRLRIAAIHPGEPRYLTLIAADGHYDIALLAQRIQ